MFVGLSFKLINFMRRIDAAVADATQRVYHTTLFVAHVRKRITRFASFGLSARAFTINYNMFYKVD